MDDKKWFSAQQLAKLGHEKVIDFPRTERNSREKARKLKWSEKDIPCRGGKNGYMAVFKPPVDILNQILAFMKKNRDFFDDTYMPGPTSKHRPINTTAQMVTSATPVDSNNHSMVKNFITLPKYALQSMPDRVIQSDQVVDYLAFNKDWLEMSLNVKCNRLALIQVKGDSMEPTLKSDDLILTDISQSHIGDDSIYVLQMQNDLVLKRIQRKINGSVIIKSDNPVYGEEILDETAAQALPVVGRVIWYGRRI